MKKLLLLLLCVVTLLAADQRDSFKINLGVMNVTNFETELQLAPKGSPVGAYINTKDQLNMKNDTNVFRVDGYYRFNETHSIDFSYFSVKSDGLSSGTIEYDDKNITSGSISSYFNMDIYKINYGYSFYHNDKVELALTAGFHITAIKLGLFAYGIVDGKEATHYRSETSVTAPLPVVGFKGEYTIIKKKLFVNYKADYFFLSIDKYQGALISTSLNCEYRFMNNFGMGIGYNSNNIRLKANGNNAKVDIHNTLSGAMIYISYVH
jgi:hypothetical protein